MREQGAQHVFRRKRIVAGLGVPLVRGGGPDGFRRSRLDNGNGRMRESAVQFCREPEIGIHARGHAAPLFPHSRLDMPVKRGVDLDQIEELRQIFDSGVRFERVVNNPLPVLIRPAGHADFDVAAVAT